MLVVLALIGCGEGPDAVDGVEVDVVTPDPRDADAELRMATAPDRAAFARAPVIEAPLPAGEPIVRDCFGGVGGDGAGASNRRVRGGGGSGPRPTRARPPARPQPSVGAPSSAPSPVAAPATGTGDLGSKGGGAEAGYDPAAGRSNDRGGDVSGRTSSRAPVAEPAKSKAQPAAKPTAKPAAKPTAKPTATPAAQPAAPPAMEPEAEPAEPDAPDARPAADPVGGHPAQREAQTRSERERADGFDDELAEKDVEQAKRPEPQRDWGATVYLSNDDSMSLASAQRVLYALSRGVSLSPSEVRPHELLNYFSFDTVPPAGDRTFGVLGAAEQHGDKLTVSLAVRGANPPRQPLDLTVLLDRSCSMAGEDRMEYTRRGLNLLSDNLQRGDRVDVVLFDSDVCTPLENFVVGRDDPSLLREVVEQIQPTSATNLDAGLREAYRIQTGRDAADTHGRNRRVLLVTDAELNTGNVSEALVSEVGSALDEHKVRLSGVGVGRDFNDRMLDLLTEKGRGAYVYLGSEAVVDRIFGPGFDALVRTVASDVQFSLDLPDSLAMERFYGEESSTDKADVKPIHYHAGTTQLFLQDLAIKDGRLVESDPITMKIEFRDALTGEPVTEELRATVGALIGADPHNLRKGQALMAFSDWVLAGSMGADACGAPLAAYRERSLLVSDDAEIGFVNGLVGGRCGVDLATVVAASRGVELKVRVDADIPISQVELACGARTHLEAVSASDTVARFVAVEPGACTVRLEGTTPMAAAVDVPPTGGDLRCMVRGGRLACR